MNRNARVTATALAVAVLVAGLVWLGGCKPTQPAVTKENQEETVARNPWDVVREQLKKNTDLVACKGAIGQLKELAGREKELQPPGPTPETEAALVAVAPLSPADLAESRSATYTPLDAVYLADCFYLRDAANKPLGSPGLPPARRAELAFAWVCRQVYLDPWVLSLSNGNHVSAALPPTYVLRRGSGSGLERAYVFLALLQQMNIDACLIGPPEAGTKEASPAYPPTTTTPARGPFWAIGVRIDNDILLFDPWRGKAFPEPLSKLKANPDALKAWFEEKDPASPLTAQDVKNAAVFLAAPVNALAPRMAYFEEKVKGDTGVTVAVNAAGLLERVRKVAPPGTAVAFWNPPAADRFAYIRVLPEFLPVSESGRDRTPDQTRLYTQYQQAMLPESVLQLPPLRSPAAVIRLRMAALGVYESAFFTPPTPRERLQRGQFQDAASFLNDKQDAFKRGQERLRQALANPNLIIDWSQRLDALYTELGRARRPAIGGAELPDNDPDVAFALGMIEQFWKAEGQTAQIIVDRATVQPGMTESTFLLALCKHEEAEQAQLRADTATGANAAATKEKALLAWGEAVGLWRSYLEQVAGIDPFPKRVEHARALAARANEFAKKK